MVCKELTPSEEKKISKAIKDMLLKDWDPIGIYRTGPDDRYDSYIWLVLKLLRDGTDSKKVADYLYELEKDVMVSFPNIKENLNQLISKHYSGNSHSKIFLTKILFNSY